MCEKMCIAVLLLVLVPSALSKCQKSFMTICDNFKDLKNLSEIINIQQLMIGSPFTSQNPLTSINLNKDIPWSKLENLGSFYIYQKFSNLEVDESITLNCESYYKLNDITLYGNILNTITAKQFPQISLKTLNLANNSIQQIKPGALYDLPVKELNLNDNYLQIITAGTLPYRVEIIKIQNNEINFIEPDSFSISLTDLWLDNNHLAYLEPKLFFTPNKLNFLSLSGNHFYSIPNVRPLEDLRSLDLSSNRIKSADVQVLRNLDKMVFLDLSNNQIDERNILLDIFQNKSEHLVVSLAFNNLESLRSFDYFTKKSLLVGEQAVLFYGNQFRCDRWNFLQKQLENHTSDCNLQFLADSQTPFCLAADSTEVHKENFKRLSRQRAKNFYCKDYGGKYSYVSSLVSQGCSESASAVFTTDEDYD